MLMVWIVCGGRGFLVAARLAPDSRQQEHEQRAGVRMAARSRRDLVWGQVV